MKKLPLISILSITIIGFLSLLTHYQAPLLAWLLLGVGIPTAIIFSVEKAFVWRYLYPGLLCFIFFMILPMAFTIFIAFTNLSTGHFLSFEKVQKLLLQEEVTPTDPIIQPFELYFSSTEDHYLVWLPQGKSSAQFKLPSDHTLAILVSDTNLPSSGLQKLSPLEIQNLWDQLREFSFELKTHSLRFYRTDLLMNTTSRFAKLDDDRLQDQITGQIFIANHELGYFEEAKTKARLAPGFSTIVGGQNFNRLLATDGIRTSFLQVFTWTLLWAGISVALSFSLGISLALFLNDKNLRFKALYRNLLIMPYSIPFFISVLIFKGLLNKDFGQINTLLGMIGIEAIPWLEHHLWAKVSCLLVNLWLGFPYMFLVTTGILQSIPTSLYEASALEGSTRLQNFRYITLPLVMSAVAPLLVGSFAFNMNNFVGIYLLTGGGPPMQNSLTPVGETDILISYTYRLAFEGGQGQDFGLASTIAIFIFVLVAGLTALNFKLMRKNNTGLSS